MTPAQEVAKIADVPLEIEVELDRVELKIGALLDLDVDSILEMPRSAGENLDIYIGGKLVGFGEIVIIENTMGIRITDFKSEDYRRMELLQQLAAVALVLALLGAAFWLLQRNRL